MAIIEIKKTTGSGPPGNMRLSQDEIESMMTPYGFIKINMTDFGDFYMLQFMVSKQ